MRFRRSYYNLFSSFYDRFVRLHSGDRQETMRDFLVEAARLRQGHTVVDLCTGTGSSALRLARDEIRVIGVDFSEGMLEQARRKSVGCSRIHWIQADARALPILSCSVDRVTCSYAMYELSGTARREVLQEATRILKPAGMFLMMEHLPPARLLIRLLYLIRIYLLGSRGVRSFAGSEEKELRRFLFQVETVTSVGGKTKVVFGFKPSRNAEYRS
jgi:demethylmenaquinone methyltransferase/2-methoxy-6-polyprenyl-1,4-benzoquinol methylase